MSQLQKQFMIETGVDAKNNYGGASESYVNWLETKVEKFTAHNKPMPKLPTLEEVYTSIQCGPYCELSYRERHVLEACYEFIGRQLSA